MLPVLACLCARASACLLVRARERLLACARARALACLCASACLLVRARASERMFAECMLDVCKGENFRPARGLVALSSCFGFERESKDKSRNKDVLLKTTSSNHSTIKHTSPINSFGSETTKAILSYKLQ